MAWYKCIPVQRDIRPISSHSKGQCLSEASEMCQASLSALPPEGCNGSYIPLGSDTTKLLK